MKKQIGFKSSVALVILAGALGAAAWADSVVTLEGREIKGRITSENADYVTILTEDYGELRFQKMSVSQILRGDAAPPTAGGFGGGFDAGDPFASRAPRGAGGPPPVENGFGIPAANWSPPGINPPSGIDAAASAPMSAPPPMGSADRGGFGGAPASRVNPFTGLPETPPAASSSGGRGEFVPPPPPQTGGGFGASQGGGFGEPQSETTGFGRPDPGRDAPSQPPQINATNVRPEPPTPSIANGALGVVYGMSDESPLEVRANRDNQWGRAEDVAPVAQGAELRTARDGGAVIALGGGEELRLAQDTHVVFSQLSDDTSRIGIFLVRGALFADVSNRGLHGSFEIETSEGRITSPGGNLVVLRSEIGGTRLNVFDGAASITASDTRVHASVVSGDQVTITSTGQITRISPAEPQLGMWKNWGVWASSTDDESGFAPVKVLGGEIQRLNDKWDDALRDDARGMGGVEYQDKLEAYSRAFSNFARDTSHIPTEEEGWSVLIFDSGIPGWNGPYLDESVPPLDPWRRPLVYKVLKSRSGKMYGRVYSFWQDGKDQGGENSSQDRVALVMFPDV